MFHVKQKVKKKNKNGVFHVKQFDEFSEKTKEKFKIYEETLKKWQKKINLVSPTTLSDIINRHIMDSAQLAPLIIGRHKKILDMGSGAGFPGLVLAILNQNEGRGDWNVHLVESDARKCAFIQEVARLTNTKIYLHNCRIESLTDFKADVITARALKEVKTLIEYAVPFLLPGTHCLFLKGKNVDLELEWATNSYNFVAKKIPSITQGSFILEITEISE